MSIKQAQNRENKRKLVSGLSPRAQAFYYLNLAKNGENKLPEAPEDLLKDLEFAKKYVEIFPNTLTYFSQNLGNDKELILKAFQSGTDKKEQLRGGSQFNTWISLDLRDSPEFVLDAIKANTSCFIVLYLPLFRKLMQANKLVYHDNFVLEGIKHNSTLIKEIKKWSNDEHPFLEDLDFATECLKNDPTGTTFDDFCEDIRNDEDMVIASLRKQGIANCLRKVPSVDIVFSKKVMMATIKKSVVESADYYMIAEDFDGEHFHCTERNPFVQFLKNDLTGKQRMNCLKQIAEREDVKDNGEIVLTSTVLISIMSDEDIQKVQKEMPFFDELVKEELHKRNIDIISMMRVAKSKKFKEGLTKRKIL